jgi:phytoene dehydrogenase-like protein
MHPIPPNRTRFENVVIGSGHNGLVAAAYLAAAGQSVLVLERNDVVGGATASQRVFADYDAWLSRYSYLISLLPQTIIDELELQFETRRRTTASFTPYRDAAGMDRGLVLSNVDQGRSRESVMQLAGSSKDWQGYQHFLKLQTALAEVAWPSMLQPLQSRTWFQSRLAGDAQREAWDLFVERPLGEAIEKYIHNDVLRGLVMTDGKIGVFTHPHDGSLLQNRCFLYHVIGGGTGEWRVPVGGMRSLVDALVTKCTRHGVTLATNSTALAIDTGEQGHAVTFAHDAGERTIEANNILVNAGPRTFAKLLGRSWQPEQTDEGSVIKINMLLKRLPRVKARGVGSQEAFAGSFHIDEGYQQMLASYRMAAQGQIPEPAPGEIYCHTLTDDSILSPELRDQGFHTLTLFGLDMPYRLFDNPNHDARRERVKQLYLEGLDRICDEPFADCLARDRDGKPCIEIKTPQELEQELDLDLGNIFHNTLTWFFTDDSEVEGTWGVETDVPGIYRAGSSAYRGGAVSGIPGRCAAMAILGRRN